MHDVRAREPRPQRPRPRVASAIAASRFGIVRASQVLVRDLGRQPARAVGRDRRQQHPVVELAAAGERPQQLARVRLAAAELARHEREERDPDHARDRTARRRPAGRLSHVLRPRGRGEVEPATSRGNG